MASEFTGPKPESGSAAVRTYLERYPQASGKEVMDGVKAVWGYTVASPLVSKIRGEMGLRTGRGRPPGSGKKEEGAGESGGSAAVAPAVKRTPRAAPSTPQVATLGPDELFEFREISL